MRYINISCESKKEGISVHAWVTSVSVIRVSMWIGRTLWLQNKKINSQLVFSTLISSFGLHPFYQSVRVAKLQNAPFRIFVGTLFNIPLNILTEMVSAYTDDRFTKIHHHQLDLGRTI